MDILGYVRVSGLSQVDGDGFRRQDEAIARYCLEKGFNYLACYVEHGVTGDSDVRGRVALLSLSNAMKKGGDFEYVKTVVVEHPDRMARSIIASVTILSDFRVLDAAVFCANDGSRWTVNDNDPEAMLIWSIRASISQYEKSRVRARQEHGKAMKRQAGGKADGRYRYGHAPALIDGSNEKALARMSRERSIMEKIRQMHRLGASEVTRRLNLAGLVKRNGKKWQSQELGRVMKAMGLPAGKAGRKPWKHLAA